VRRRAVRKAVYRAFAAGCNRFGFRLVHFSLQKNHIHLLCEAEDERSLARGMQGLSIRVSKSINRALGRAGRVQADRYHARALRTPREVRNALGYVLNNAQHHREWRTPFDPCSSASLFLTGWRPGVLFPSDSLDELCEHGPPVVAARTWLLGTGWRRHGLLDPNLVPGSPPWPKSATRREARARAKPIRLLPSLRHLVTSTATARSKPRRRPGELPG
jgi:REP element-mobilizing transposase RayT